MVMAQNVGFCVRGPVADDTDMFPRAVINIGHPSLSPETAGP